MQWLLHGPMTYAVAEALVRHGHAVHKLEDADLPADAAPQEVLKAAQDRQWDLFTTDAELSRAPFETDYWFRRSIVFLQVEGGDVEQDDAVDRLFERYKRLAPGRLYTVTGRRVKIRQLPGPRHNRPVHEEPAE